MVPKWEYVCKDETQRHYLPYIGDISSINCATLSHSNLVWLEPVAASDCKRYFLQSFLGIATVQKEITTPPQQHLPSIYSRTLR